MKEIKLLFFWLGGVIIQPIPELTVQVISGQSIEAIDVASRISLRELAQALYLGRITGQIYCRRVIDLFQASLEVEEVSAKIIQTAVLQPSVIETIDCLPSTCQTWLIADYPPDWFLPLADRLALKARFPEEQVVFASNSGLPRLVPDIFYYIVRRSRLPLENCMLVDGDIRRAIAAVRHGLSSTIFVDARRLRRDFTLRKLIQ